MADIFTLHSMCVFLFVRDAVRAALSRMWLDVSCCRRCVSPHSAVSPRVHVLPHNRLRSAVLSQSLAGIKEPEPVKRNAELVVWPPFVSFLPNLFFRGQEAICLQTKEPMQASPSLPTSQRREAKISPRGLFLIWPLRLSCRAEMHGMVCVGLFKECRPQWQISSPVVSLSWLSAS